MKDNVNHPDHYKDGGVEVIDFIEAKNLDYHLGNVVKYVSRAGKKDPQKKVEDLKKANWYLTRKIGDLEDTNYLEMHQLMENLYDLYCKYNLLVVPKVHVDDKLFSGFSCTIYFRDIENQELYQMAVTCMRDSYIEVLEDAVHTAYNLVKLEDYSNLVKGVLEVLQKYQLITNI
jgi:hypothetical protein